MALNQCYDELSKPFSSKEIFDTFKLMNPCKAPGTKGF